MRYLAIFVIVALLSYGGFAWLSSQLQAEEIMPTMQPPQPKETKVKIPQKRKTKTVEIPDKPIDTSIYKKNKAGYYDISWKMLSKVEFNEEFVDSLDAYVPFPIFSPEVKYLEDKNIEIKGYVIPIEETGDETLLVLSANPYSSCFFCGGAGPETVMDIKLQAKSKGRYKMDDMTTFRGRLRLNDSDLYYLNYILENAEHVK